MNNNSNVEEHKCISCKGTGTLECTCIESSNDCILCNGHGEFECPICEGTGIF
ncbi:MAG: hypothetical protein RR620_04585 [Clostridium sp.]